MTLDDAKADFDGLVARVRDGEEVVIASEGRPMMRVSLVETSPEPPRRRVFGQLAGQVRIGPDFDDPLDEETLAAFEGRGRLWPDDP